MFLCSEEYSEVTRQSARNTVDHEDIDRNTQYGVIVAMNHIVQSYFSRSNVTRSTHPKKHVIRTIVSAILIPIKKVLLGDDMFFLVKTFINRIFVIKPKFMIIIEITLWIGM